MDDCNHYWHKNEYDSTIYCADCQQHVDIKYIKDLESCNKDLLQSESENCMKIFAQYKRVSTLEVDKWMFLCIGACIASLVYALLVSIFPPN